MRGSINTSPIVLIVLDRRETDRHTSPVLTETQPAALVHPFASFGPGPYKLIGMEDTAARMEINANRESNGLAFTTNMCGGSCDHCGTAIWNVFKFRAANGVTFKTGETCAEKANEPGLSADDYAIRAAARALKAQINKVKLARKHATDAAKITAAELWIGHNRDELDALPHPRDFAGQTFLDNLRWTRANAGTAGKLKAYRAAYKALGQTMPRVDAR